MDTITPSSASVQCLWKPNRVTPASWSHASRTPRFLFASNPPTGNLVVFASGDDAYKRPREPPRRIKLDDQDMMDLKFGRLLGEDPQKTWSKVMGRKSNPDATYLDIEKPVKRGNDLHLECPLQNSSREGEEHQPAYISNEQSVSSINTGKGKFLDLIRPVMRRDGKQMMSPSESTRNGSHKKQSHTKSDSKNSTQEVVLRKPTFARNQGNEIMGSAARPHISLRRKEDSAKRNLEDTGLLRRPEIIRLDLNLNKGSKDLKVKEGLTEDSSGSKANATDIYAVAEKQAIESADEKIENKISMIRPTIPRDPLAQTPLEGESQTLHGKVEDGNSLQRIVSQGKEGVHNRSPGKAQTMGGFDSVSCASDKMTNGDINTSSPSSLPVTSPNNMETWKTKEHLICQDCKEDLEITAEVQSIQLANYDVSSIKSEVVQSEAVISRDPSSDHLLEATSIEKVLPNFPELPGHGLEIQMPALQSNAMGNITSSVGTEDTSDQAMNRRPLIDSGLRKPFYRTGPLADSGHARQVDRNMDISDQRNEILSQSVQEGEDDDWAWAETLHDSGGFGEVELLSCNSRGFAVSFGSLIGLLPYRELGPRRRPFSFEEWLQLKGLDPSKFKKDNVSEGTGNFQIRMSMLGLTSAPKNKERMQSEEERLAVLMTKEHQDLLNMFNQERMSFLSSFLGQKTRAGVTLVDRRARILVFSEKLRETRELAEKKANLMDKLNIGDVVTCQVTRITSFGVFVELEGVPALIHHTELSWDLVWDARSFLKSGEVVEAKVCRLDHSLQRINLSLKQMKPDPLLETLESVVNGKSGSVNQSIEPDEQNTEWAELEALISELKLVAGIQSVSKGRFLLSPGLAPAFQVYLSDSHGTQYKLLARAGNRVQEVVVEASLDREGMKSAVVSCTSRVA